MKNLRRKITTGLIVSLVAFLGLALSLYLRCTTAFTEAWKSTAVQGFENTESYEEFLNFYTESQTAALSKLPMLGGVLTDRIDHMRSGLLFYSSNFALEKKSRFSDPILNQKYLADADKTEDSDFSYLTERFLYSAGYGRFVADLLIKEE